MHATLLGTIRILWNSHKCTAIPRDTASLSFSTGYFLSCCHFFLKTDISSKATQSVKSEVMNLSTKDLSLNFDAVTKAVAKLFCQIYAPGKNVEIKDIDPSREDHFPGIRVFKKELQVCESM